MFELDIEEAIRRCGLPPDEVQRAVEALCGPGGPWHGLVARRDLTTLVSAADFPTLLGALAAARGPGPTREAQRASGWVAPATQPATASATSRASRPGRSPAG